MDEIHNGSHFLKIFFLQIYNSTPDHCVEKMTKYIHEEYQKDCQKINFIILPEGALSYLGELNSDRIPSELECLSNFAAYHQIILICGTLTETESLNNETQCYTTCLVIDQAGQVILKYRKRDTMGMMNDGNEVGICDTIYGKIGVLICYDAERPAFIEDTLAHSPKIIFNPAHLSTFQGIPKSLIYSSWKVALDTSSRYFEHISQSTGITFVRCDQPRSGNTFLTTPSQTIFIPSLAEQSLSVLVPISYDRCDTFPFPESQLQLPSSFGRIRTEKLDNTGLRSTIHSIPREKRAGGVTQNNQIIQIGIILPTGKPKGRIVILTTSSLEIWDPIDSSLYYSFDISNEKKFDGCIIEENGRIKATDTQNIIYEWTPNHGGYELEIRDLETHLANIKRLETIVTITDHIERVWALQIDHKADFQCPLSHSDHFTHPSISSSALCFHPSDSSFIYRIILPVSCHYNNPLTSTLASLHYDQRVFYIPIVTDEYIHILSFFHNRVAVKIVDILSSIELLT